MALYNWKKQSSEGKSPKLSAYEKALLDTHKRVVVALGLPLTGKTALAIKCAMHDLRNGFYDRIILIREPIKSHCGFLKGDHLTKMAPYISQADRYMQQNGNETIEELMMRGVVEVQEPAFLQGNRFERCYVIIDEAQNIPKELTFQMLTRVDVGCKYVIAGDISTGQENEKLKIEKSMPYYLFHEFSEDEDLAPYMSFHTFYDKENDILGDDFCKLIINKLYKDFVNVEDAVVNYAKAI